MKNNNDQMAKQALKAIAQEELSAFIDSKEISDTELKKALLTAADINILCNEYNKKHTEEKEEELLTKR